MYTKDGESYFIVDAHVALWDARPENQRNVHGRQFIDCFYDYHRNLSPESEQWSYEEYLYQGGERLLHDLFEVGYVDHAIFQPANLWEFYHRGFGQTEEASALAAAHPDKLTYNHYFDPRDGEAGREKSERKHDGAERHEHRTNKCAEDLFGLAHGGSMNLMSTDALRFPVGKFAAVPGLDRAAYAARIDEIAAAPAIIAGLAGAMTPAQLATPYREGGWTAAQVIHHMADSHMNAYIRTRFALAEDNFTVKPYDEVRWSQFPDAQSTDVTGSLQILQGLHARWTTLLRTLTPAEFAVFSRMRALRAELAKARAQPGRNACHFIPPTPLLPG